MKGGAFPRGQPGSSGAHPAAAAHEGPAPAARRRAGASVSPNTRRAYAGALRRLDAAERTASRKAAEGARTRTASGVVLVGHLVEDDDGQVLGRRGDAAADALGTGDASPDLAHREKQVQQSHGQPREGGAGLAPPGCVPAAGPAQGAPDRERVDCGRGESRARPRNATVRGALDEDNECSHHTRWVRRDAT